jgi:hypothetical protein
MKRSLFFLVSLFALLTPGRAALPNFTSIWEVESGSNDTNGGGFDSAGSGTDMSQFANKNAAACSSCQSATVNISTTDAVCAGTTALMSATANFSAALIGNFVRLNGGSGSLAAVWKEVTAFTNVTTVTLDSTCAAGTGITLNIGGALATPGQCSTNMALSTAAGCWVKAGTYSITAMISLASGATNNGMAFMSGYTSTRGDLAFSNCFTATCPVLQAAAGLAGADNAIVRFSGSPSGTVFSNAVLDCNSQTFTAGLRYNTAYQTASNIYAKGCSDPAFDVENVGEVCDRCTSTNSPAAGITGGHPTVSAMHIAGGDVIQLYNSAFLGSTVNGAIGINGACAGSYQNVVVANFTGTTADAVVCTVLEYAAELINFSIYNVTRHAFHFTLNSNVDSRPFFIRNAVISSIAGYCFIQDGTLTFRAPVFLSDHNFCNTSGALGFYNGWPAGTGDVTLTAGPFTAPGSNDFSLNSTAGGGTAVKGAGFPGTVSAGVGHLDGGSIQSAAGAAGAQAVSAYAQ